LDLPFALVDDDVLPSIGSSCNVIAVDVLPVLLPVTETGYRSSASGGD